MRPDAAQAPATAAASPAGERIALLDVVRGMALLGILVMNMPAFTDAGVHAGGGATHRAAEVVRDMLFAGKFNSIFSLLFGLGFTLQLARLEARWPQAATAVYLRRLGWLFALGLVHAVFFFSGDVLHIYAMFGLGLLWLRRWPDRALVVLMAACLVAPALSQLLRALMAVPGAGGATLATAAAGGNWTPQELHAFGHGSFGEATRAAMNAFVTMYTDPHELRQHLGFYAQILTTMVLGLLIGRHRFLQRLPELMPRIVVIQRTSLVLGLACTIVYGLGHDVTDSAAASPMRALVGSCYVLARLALMSFYVLTIVRAMQQPRWQRRLAPFGAAGRMPLTNYLLQTALCSLLFYGYGFGLWNRVGALGELLLAPLLFFGIQLPLSLWWLARFEQGPFEWLWRRLTYGRRPPH